ncbi:MAG: ribosome silencing factor [Chloroflexi bacterium]|nr:ribosome silencing factor [Chloroflexota bacterium]
MEILELARRAAELASEKRAEDVLLLDLRRSCGFADYFVLCTAASEPQVKAVAEALEDTLPREGLRLLHAEGVPASGWVLLDFGAVVVHIFAPPEREYYNLEELWREAAPLLRIQ